MWLSLYQKVYYHTCQSRLWDSRSIESPSKGGNSCLRGVSPLDLLRLSRAIAAKQWLHVHAAFCGVGAEAQGARTQSAGGHALSAQELCGTVWS